MKPIFPMHITIKDLQRGFETKYDFTPELEANAKDLLERVNKCIDMVDAQLVLLGQPKISPVRVTSGWRPKAYNDTIPNAAKKSRHIFCQAVDIADPGERFTKYLEQDFKKYGKDSILAVCGLWVEASQSVNGWTHLDTGVRNDASYGVFIA